MAKKTKQSGKRAKTKETPMAAEAPPSKTTSERKSKRGRKKGNASGEKPGYPSRAKVRYVGLPIDLYSWLEEWADSKSTPYDDRGIAWAARQAVYWFKRHIESEQGSSDSSTPP